VKMVPKNLTNKRLQHRREVFATNWEWWRAEQSHQWGWKLGFSAWPCDKGAENAMEISRLSPSQ
jgi:hypothetical protein